MHIKNLVDIFLERDQDSLLLLFKKINMTINNLKICNCDLPMYWWLHTLQAHHLLLIFSVKPA